MSSLFNVLPEVEQNALGKIDSLDQELSVYFKEKFLVQPSLTRILVSFQANKNKPIYRWYKYKEAFSASLVELLCHKYGITQGKVSRGDRPVQAATV